MSTARPLSPQAAALLVELTEAFGETWFLPNEIAATRWTYNLGVTLRSHGLLEARPLSQNDPNRLAPNRAKWEYRVVSP